MTEPSTLLSKKRKGPAPTGKGTLIGVRLQPPLLAAVRSFAAGEPDKPSLPEAIRKLVARSLDV